MPEFILTLSDLEDENPGLLFILLAVSTIVVSIIIAYFQFHWECIRGTHSYTERAGIKHGITELENDEFASSEKYLYRCPKCKRKKAFSRPHYPPL